MALWVECQPNMQMNAGSNPHTTLCLLSLLFKSDRWETSEEQQNMVSIENNESMKSFREIT